MNILLRQKILTIIGIAAVFHLVWENAQAPLYAGYQNFWQHFWMCLAVIPGDVAITLVAYAAVAAWRRNWSWANIGRFSDLLAAGLVATLVSVVIERYSIAMGRWSYGPMMPMVPWLHVGLLPVLQMLFIPPITFYLVEQWVKKNVV